MSDWAMHVVRGVDNQEVVRSWGGGVAVLW